VAVAALSLPELPKLPKIAEIGLPIQTGLHNSFSIWILWQLPILAIANSSCHIQPLITE
jgi:hypothetical protein